MVRVSGSRALEVAGRIFTPRREGAFPPSPRTAVFGHVHAPDDPGDSIDQAVLLYFAPPQSATGETVVEITVHGSPAVQDALLRACLSAGACLAEPGEFTRRAFLNGKMDLTQAEAVAGLIHAATEGARKVLLRQVEGAMGREAAGMREDLLAASASTTALLDFPEDVPEEFLDEAAARVETAGKRAEALLAGAGAGIALSCGKTVVLAGSPNVGKSSLLNALLREERAIIHPQPGTTRDPVEARADLGGVPVRLVDTAGIRSGDGKGREMEEVEAEGIRRARRWMEGADLILLVTDSSHPAGPEDLALREETAAIPRLLVANKCDLPAAAGGIPEGALRTSALTGEGVGELAEVLRRALLAGEEAGEGAVAVTARQREALAGMADSCRRFLSGYRVGTPPECLAVDLAEAIRFLGELTGEVTGEEVLDRIFSTFCVGK